MKRIFLNLTLVLFVIPFGISQDLPSYVPTDGLVAYYPFNGNANDASGNGNDGVNTGAVLTIDRHGNSDSAFYFSGSSCSTRIDADVDMSSVLSSMSVSMWVNRNGNGCYNPRLFDFYDGGNNSNDWGEVWFNGANLFNLSGSGYSDNDKWYNITIIINNSENSRKYFIDGNLVNNIPNTKTLPLAGDFSIGRMNHPAYDAFNGIIDDFGIWNRALTEQEIQNLYNSSTGDIILNGVVSAEDNQIKNVGDPTEAQDAVTKSYTDTKFYTQIEVDALIANLQQQINEMNENQVASSIELVEVFLIPNSRNIIKTSDSKYIIRTESDVFESNAIDGNYESLNFNINVSRGDIQGHLLGETPNQSLLISTKDNGLFRFENENWSASGLSGSGTSGNDFLRLNNDRILIAKQGFSRKIYYSDDNGVNWSTSSGTNNEDWRDFSVSSSGTIFIGSPGNVGGVLRSQDNGLSFERIRTEKCRSTSTIGEVVYIISLNEENNNVLMKSTDDGATWTELFIFNNFKSGGYVEITFYAGNIIVLNDEKIFWSKIDEINFSETLLPSDYGSFREISHIDDKIYAVYDRGIFAVNGQY